MLGMSALASHLLSLPVLAWAVGWQEILVIVVVVLILFGGRKIPELAKGLGRGLREFKREMSGIKKDFDEATADTDEEEEEYDRPRRRRRRRPAPGAGEGSVPSEDDLRSKPTSGSAENKPSVKEDANSNVK